MKTTFKLMILSLLTITMTSCPIQNDLGDDFYMPINIYKTNNNYSNNVQVLLYQDRIIRAEPTVFVTELTNNYYAQRSVQAYLDIIVYLSITKSEWKQNINGVTKMNDEEISNYIIDKDPFVEYYREKEEYYGIFAKKENTSNSIDTAKINDIIRKGELTIYFNKLK